MFKAKVLWQLSNPFIRLTYAFALCTRWILGMPCGSRHPPWFWWSSISIFGEVLMLMLLIDTNRHGCTSMLGLLPIKSSNSVFNIFDLCLCYFLFMWFGYMGSVYQKVTVPKSSCELRHSQGVFSQKGCINVISGGMRSFMQKLGMFPGIHTSQWLPAIVCQHSPRSPPTGSDACWPPFWTCAGTCRGGLALWNYGACHPSTTTRWRWFWPRWSGQLRVSWVCLI